MEKHLKTVLLAYGDNPVGTLFLSACIRNDVPVAAVITEAGPNTSPWKRFKKKIAKDGLAGAFIRVAQVFLLAMRKKRIGDMAGYRGIPVHTVERFNSTACEVLIDELSPDILLIASAPILEERIFSKASRGCLNVHPGWLPAYRGIGANAYALYNGDKPGVTVHFIDKSIDKGSIIKREHVAVKKRDTIAKINDRAVKRGADLVCGVIKTMSSGPLTMPEIKEGAGPVYRAMPYAMAKRVNRTLKQAGGQYHGI